MKLIVLWWLKYFATGSEIGSSGMVRKVEERLVTVKNVWENEEKININLCRREQKWWQRMLGILLYNWFELLYEWRTLWPKLSYRIDDLHSHICMINIGYGVLTHGIICYVNQCQLFWIKRCNKLLYRTRDSINWNGFIYGSSYIFSHLVHLIVKECFFFLFNTWKKLLIEI